MKIQLNRLTLLNFKGIRSLDVNFGIVTTASGENATGKTTIMDAFLWLLFGKDSTDRKDFEIKTLGPDNQPYHRMDHEVTGYMEVDGVETVLRKTYKENWVKKRGEADHVFSGHTTSYFWNDVPLKMEEFQAKISEIQPENIFKLITNTGYFNSLPWQRQRDTLMDIAGTITNDQVLVAAGSKVAKSHWATLIKMLNENKKESEIKSQISARKKKIKDELDLIPARIDEATRSLPDPLNYLSIEEAIRQKKESLSGIENMLMDKTKAQQSAQAIIREKLNQVQQLKMDRQQVEFEIKNAVKNKKLTREQTILDKQRELSNLEKQGNDMSARRLVLQGNRSENEKLQVSLRASWNDVAGKELTFDDNSTDFHCPACKRAYEATDITAKKAELTRNFNLDKSKKLTAITERGKAIAGENISLDTQIKDLQVNIDSVIDQVKTLRETIAAAKAENETLSQGETMEITRATANSAKYKELSNRITDLEAEVNAPADDRDNGANLLQQKRGIAEEIADLNRQLSTKEQREKIGKRIVELQDQERELAQQLADQEGIEFSMDQFIRAKMNLLESRINDRFKLVKFKLFAEQINGGQVETCEALINGVPYSDANTASKINAGLDIINTLSDHYDAYAPVFLDNAEAVNNLLPVKSQMIRLVVTKEKKLKITTNEPAMAEMA
jgi:DNA repair exonuclease SbcCD ATPase subunit